MRKKENEERERKEEKEGVSHSKQIWMADSCNGRVMRNQQNLYS